jgi:hypothetical protein
MIKIPTISHPPLSWALQLFNIPAGTASAVPPCREVVGLDLDLNAMEVSTKILGKAGKKYLKKLESDGFHLGKNRNCTSRGTEPQLK